MINIYCDESCHLEHDKAKAMLLGAISCSESEKSRIYSEIRAIKERHSLSTWNEIKWTSVSPSKLSFYIEIIDYFINEPALSFRAVVAKDKSNLNHEKYNQGSHDLWYYKAYFYLLDAMIGYSEEYRIFIDIKDTCGGTKVKKLQEVFIEAHEIIEGRPEGFWHVISLEENHHFKVLPCVNDGNIELCNQNCNASHHAIVVKYGAETRNVCLLRASRLLE